jgi:geranylgeranyl diphosphate synthase type I
VGAALAGRLDELQSALSAYGDPLGEAFQLRDDLREGKPTPLLAVATANADAAQGAVLATVGQEDLSAGAVARIQEVFVATGAVEAIEASIDALTAEAVAAIEGAEITDDARAALIDLAHFVAWRES